MSAPLAHFSHTFKDYPAAEAQHRADPNAVIVRLHGEVEVTGLTGGDGGRVLFCSALIDRGGGCRLADKPADAPVFRLGGPLEITFSASPPALRVGRSSELVLIVGTPGIGPGTFAAIGHTGTVPPSVRPTVEIAFPPTKAGGAPVKEVFELKERCCGTNFYGPVRVASAVGTGTATVTASFADWKDGKVRSTTHALAIRAPKTAIQVEPVADNLVATLVHPVRDTIPGTLAYSADGRQLFVAGYPSGVVQVFDAVSRKELRQIEAAAEAGDILLSRDRKTVYVSFETRQLRSVERAGKTVRRVEESGRVRVWDLSTGEEQPSLNPPDGSAPVRARLSPDGTRLVCVERASTDLGPVATRPSDVTVLWDLKTKERKKLADAFHTPTFTPDSRSLVFVDTNYEAKAITLRVIDARSLKEQAKVECPEPERRGELSDVSPDGAVLAVCLGGKQGAPREVWFRDAKTLADRGRFVGEADPDRYGWGAGAFTPDGARYVLLNVKDKVLVWDVAGKKVERSFDLPGRAWQLAISSDGKTLAVPWVPRSEADEQRNRNPDPQDHPQPRVTLFDLAGKAAPRTLVVRHGFAGGVAFSPDGKQLAFGASGGVHLFDLTR